jgi:oxalate---CoA ligase
MTLASASTLHAVIPSASELTAIVEPTSGVRLSYAELSERVEELARLLVGRGARAGGRVAVLADNGPEVIVAFLAAARVGAAVIPINPALTATEIASVFTDLGPRLLLLEVEPSGVIGSLCAEHNVEPVVMAPVTSGPPERTQTGELALPDPDPEAVCLLLQTSGTTGRPKTVPIRQRNLAASARNIAAGYELASTDVTYCVMPLFHIHGLVGSTLATLVSGGTVVVPRRVRPSRFIADLAAENVSWVSAVPTLMGRLVGASDAAAVRDIVPLRFGRTSSSALPTELAQRFEELFGAPILEAYGMTEASHQMATNPLPPNERRLGSVGMPTGTELAIVDENWVQQPAEHSGEVVVRGPGVVDGYLDNPDANASSFRDGWFRTGDVGTISPDGYLTLVGRIKEMINRGGEKIAPREVDEVLLSHPAVREAVAFGVPDGKYGEVVHAAVVMDAEVAEKDLMAHCSERLASFKVPIKIVMVDEIPTGPTGKVQRTSLAGRLSG